MKRDGLVLGMDEDTYHGGPEFSSTAAKEILKTPAHYKHVYLDGNREKKKAWDIGTAVHSKVLGVGAATVTCPPELLASNGAMSTKAAKEWRAEQEAAGLIVVSVAEQQQVDAMAESVLAHDLARSWLEMPGHAEASMFATDPETGIRLRCRFDYLPDDDRAALDLKTTLDASRRGFMRRAHELKYHMSRAFYLHTAELAGHARKEMVFIAVENTGHYPVGVYQFSFAQVQRGERKMREAIDLFKQCRDRNEWPAYSEDIEFLDEPHYAMYEDEEDNK